MVAGFEHLKNIVWYETESTSSFGATLGPRQVFVQRYLINDNRALVAVNSLTKLDRHLNISRLFLDFEIPATVKGGGFHYLVREHLSTRAGMFLVRCDVNSRLKVVRDFFSQMIEVYLWMHSRQVCKFVKLFKLKFRC